jgi:hypothetical protein
LRLSGIALDREADPNGDGWAITDGSAGLRGQILKSDDMAEIKLFAATFLSGAAAAFTQTQPTVLGSQIVPDIAERAAYRRAKCVMQAYAQQIYRLHSTRRLLCPRSRRKGILSLRHADD